MKKINLYRVFNIFNYLFFIFLGILMLYPFWYILMFSLSGSEKALVNSYYLVPNGFSLRTYFFIFKQHLIYTGYMNTIFVTVVGTIFNLFLTTTMAYPLSLAKKLPGKKTIMNLLLFTMIFSGGLIPFYLVVKSLGMVNTLWALIIPSGLSVFYLLIMIKFLKGIPESLIESAKIDGYNDISILIRIVVPLSSAVLAALGLFYAVGHWNDYMGGVIFINSNERQILQVILRSMLVQEGLGRSTGVTEALSTPQNMRMTAIVVATVPILIVYPFLQKHFMKGILIGSVKE